MNNASKLAKVLGEIYNENFGGDYDEPFSIEWGQLRALAGDSLSDSLVRVLGKKLSKKGFVLVPLDDELVITTASDLRCRSVPGRILNDYLNKLEEIDLDDDEDDEEADDDDVEDDD